MPNTDPNAGTAPEGEEAQPETTPVVETGTPANDSEVTTLRSRNAGLDAKVTSLSEANKAAIARAEAAEARALALAEGKENGDQELRAQNEQLKADAASARQEALLNKIEAKYPETFGVLGAVAATLTEDQLAASEARMVGVESGNPAPLGANPSRAGAGAPKAIEDMNVAELQAHMRKQGNEVASAWLRGEGND